MAEAKYAGDWRDPRYNPFLRKRMERQGDVSNFIAGIPFGAIAAGLLAYDVASRYRKRRGRG